MEKEGCVGLLMQICFSCLLMVTRYWAKVALRLITLSLLQFVHKGQRKREYGRYCSLLRLRRLDASLSVLSEMPVDEDAENCSNDFGCMREVPLNTDDKLSSQWDCRPLCSANSTSLHWHRGEICCQFYLWYESHALKSPLYRRVSFI